MDFHKRVAEHATDNCSVEHVASPNQNFPSRSASKELTAKQFVESGALLLAATTASNLFQVAYTFMVARLLAPAAYGELVALLSLIMVASLPSLAIQTVTARFIAAADAKSDRIGIQTTLSALTFYVATGAGLICLALGVTAPVLTSYLHLSSTMLVLFIALSVGTALLAPIFRGALQGLRRFGLLAILLLVDIPFKVGLGLGLVALGLGTNGAVGALTLGGVAGIALGAWLIRARLSWTARKGFDWRGTLHYSIPATLTLGGIMGILSLDTIVVRHLFDPTVSGAYAAVAMTGRSLFWGTGAITMVLLPLAVRAWHRESGGLTLLLTALGCTAVLGIGALGVFSFIPALVLGTLFGDQYVTMAPLLPKYSLAILLLSFAGVLAHYLMGRDSNLVFWPPLLGMVVLLVSVASFHDSPVQIVHGLIAASLCTCFLLITLVSIEGRNLWKGWRESHSQTD